MGKVLFASYAVAVGVLILVVVIGEWFVGFDVIDKHVLGNAGLLLLFLTAIAFPFVQRCLK